MSNLIGVVKNDTIVMPVRLNSNNILVNYSMEQLTITSNTIVEISKYDKYNKKYTRTIFYEGRHWCILSNQIEVIPNGSLTEGLYL